MVLWRFHGITLKTKLPTSVLCQWTSALREQFARLRENGYQPVSIAQIREAHQGGKPLPEKAVVLTFDDGYQSFYTRVFPILQAFQWPAVWAPSAVGSILQRINK